MVQSNRWLGLTHATRYIVEHNGRLSGQLSPERAYYAPGLRETLGQDQYKHLD